MKNLDNPASPQSSTEYLVELIGISNENPSIFDNFMDIFSGLSKREQACITLLIPESGDRELDSLIRKSRRQKMAGEVLNGWLARCANVPHAARIEPEGTVEGALQFADELIKQLEGE